MDVPVGTYFKNFALNQTKIRMLDGFAVSALAVGTYLGDCDEVTDRASEQALVLAAQNGINFFDTAINYRCQRSEKNIAYALRKLASLGVSREQIFVSTKGGYLPALDDPDGFREYILKFYLNTGIMAPEDIVAGIHCMTPQYLQSQIDLSLNNLKTDYIDLYYLHNPATQLAVVGQKEFYKRLRLAFALFEENVSLGKIKRYGIASWSDFRLPFGSPDLIDLDEVMRCARDVALARHHFRAIQLPYNLAMLEAVGLRNQKIGHEPYPVIPAAVHHGLSVIISAPLLQGHVLEIPEAVYARMPGPATKMQKALQFVTSSPGVTAAMVGMKTNAHVDENLKVLHMPVWGVEELQEISKNIVKSGY